jgi:hypothetical protein
MIAAIITVTVAASVVGAVWWRQWFLRERPLELWEREWKSPSELMASLAEKTGFRVETLPPGWDWVLDFSFVTVWFFWGDLRTRRPTRQLKRFRLVGTSHDRDAHVTFGHDEVTLSINAAEVSLWVDADRPLRDQEGVRALLPVDGEKWAAGVAALERAFALGVRRITTTDGRLCATGHAGALRPETWDPLFGVLVALAGAAK